MNLLKNLGFMQGRLSPTKKNKIQFFPEKHWKREFKLASILGLKNLEWTLDYKNLLKNPIFNDKGKKNIKYLCSKYKVEIKSLTGDCFMQKPFWEQKKKEKYINYLKKIINACGVLNIKFIIFPLVDKSSIKNSKIENIIINELKKITYLLKKNKLMLLFESDYNPKKLKNFIEKFDTKYFAINYDMGNSASMGYDVNEEFLNYGKYIKNIHIKDRLFKGKTVRLGYGNVNFEAVFKNIEKINYNNLLIFQTARSIKKNKDFDELKKNFNFIKNYLN